MTEYLNLALATCSYFWCYILSGADPEFGKRGGGGGGGGTLLKKVEEQKKKKRSQQ